MLERYQVKKDARFFKYKLLQIAVLIIVSLVIYLVYVVFDLERFEKKNDSLEKPINKDDLRPQNIFKKYLPSEKKSE